ncbi:MAG: PadR family transcriptional regulator [Candidatus Eisenbacteria bacterium]|uniref:PadR family transcriptional regulator n=1 Tax=Eiseniibacteriota bacterium TaxID=2212470 RepID=A0A956LZN5_UNCEI|nr:PadR family transcriptional regulator [Candidatus Eisenbacteria bacterium]
MSIPNCLLAILAERPTHGYGLKSAFEQSTANTWPLNVGQVYTTLARLRRDGLVTDAPGADAGPDDPSTGDPRQVWSITERGRDALEHWFADPVAEEPPSRDELTLKVLLAVAGRSMDVTPILQTQRLATVRRLQDYTRHKQAADPARDLAWLLLLDSLILKAEAELKWIDLCDARLREHEGRSD